MVMIDPALYFPWKIPIWPPEKHGTDCR